MEPQEIKMYREIQRNTESAMKALDTIADKVYDDQLAMQISRQSLQYSRLHDEAVGKLVEARAPEYQSTYLQDALQRGAIHYNTLFNTSTGYLAELMIKDSSAQIVELQKALNHNSEAGERPVRLARELIDLEEKHIASLKKYL